MRIDGVDLVVWQVPGEADAEDGGWRVMSDACPHRLAPLSEGHFAQSSMGSWSPGRLEGSTKCLQPAARVESSLVGEVRLPRLGVRRPGQLHQDPPSGGPTKSRPFKALAQEEAARKMRESERSRAGRGCTQSF